MVPLSCLNPIGEGVYQVGELILYAHPFLRRSFSRHNNVNTPFLGRLQKMQQNGIPAKVALDSSLVGLASTYVPPMEFEYWWGPKFDEDLTKIQTGVSRYKGSDVDRVFYGIAHTEFWWQSRDGHRILETEELRDEELRTEEVQGYFCRYAHSMINEASGAVTHFDGAVRAYTDETILQRVDADLKQAGRNAAYTKLWRLDSPIPISEWKGLLSDYYRDNRLVGEYMGAEPEPSTLSMKSDSEPAGENNAAFDLKDYVPHAASLLQGMHISLTYHPPRVRAGAERQAIPLHAFERSTESKELFGSAVIELRKALKRLGYPLEISNTDMVLHYKDMQVDFGVIGHGEQARTQPEVIHETITGIQSLVEAWDRQGGRGSVAFALAFPVEEKEAQLSFIGNIGDVKEWLANPLSRFPTERNELHKWLEKVAAFLRANYAIVEDESPLLNDLLPFTGTLMTRKIVSAIKFHQDDIGLKWSMDLEKIEKAPGLLEAMERGEVMPVPCFLVDKSECSHCGERYYDCDCSVALDENIAQNIVSVTQIFGIWSDRNSLIERTLCIFRK